METNAIYAHRLAQLKQIIGLDRCLSLAGADFNVPEQPERYLMVADAEGASPRISLAPNAQELALDCQNSEVAKNSVTQFWDLDGEGALLTPQTEILGFFTPEKAFLSAIDKRDGLSEKEACQAIQSARSKYVRSDGNIDIDPDAQLGVCETGILVEAWVWVSFDDTKVCPECKKTTADEHAHCNGKDCQETVTPDAMYYSTPCGTFCNGCMGAHAKDCTVCAHQFGLPSATEGTEK